MICHKKQRKHLSSPKPQICVDGVHVCKHAATELLRAFFSLLLLRNGQTKKMVKRKCYLMAEMRKKAHGQAIRKNQVGGEKKCCVRAELPAGINNQHWRLIKSQSHWHVSAHRPLNRFSTFCRIVPLWPFRPFWNVLANGAARLWQHIFGVRVHFLLHAQHCLFSSPNNKHFAHPLFNIRLRPAKCHIVTAS